MAFSAEPATKRGLDYKWVVLINTTVGVVMSSLDGSILTISLPSIMHSVNASVVEVMWMVMGYSLMTTALLLPLARLADMKGRVKLYNLGFAIFTLSSGLCGFSQTGTQLLAFRLVQAVGAALLISNSTALVIDAFPDWQRGTALGINMLAGTTGFLAGTILGGAITEFVSWRYIFFINLPFGLFATIWAYVKLHEMVEPERNAKFDIGGMVTFPLGIASLLAGFTFIVLGRWGDATTNLCFALATGLFAVFYVIERRVAEPMMDLDLFRIRMFWTGNSSLFLNTLSRGANAFIMTWYFQTVLNDPPLIAGLKLIPLTATIAILSPLSGRLSDRIGSRWLTTPGLIVSLGAQLWMATFPVSVSYVYLATSFVLLGIGNGLFQTPNTSAVMSAVPSHRRGVAAGSRNLLFNTGQTMAVAVAMVILSTRMSYSTLVELFSGTSAGAQAVDSAAFMDGLHKVFFTGAMLTTVAVVFSALRGKEIHSVRPSAEVTPAVADIEPEVALA